MLTVLMRVLVPSLLVLGRVVAAQGDPTPTGADPSNPLPSGGLSGIPPCTEKCVLQAATTSGCSSDIITELQCVCSKPAFLMIAEACVTSACPASEAATAAQDFALLCGAGVSPSLSGVVTPPTSTASASVGTGSRSASAPLSGSTSRSATPHSAFPSAPSGSGSPRPASLSANSTSASMNVSGSARGPSAALSSGTPLSARPSTLTVAPAASAGSPSLAADALSSSSSASVSASADVSSAPPAPSPANSTVPAHNAALGVRAGGGGIVAVAVAGVLVGAGFVL